MAQLTMAGTSARKRSGNRAGSIALTVILVLAIVYLVLPLLATFAFSIAKIWSRTILPDGYTLHWYRAAVDDERFAPTVTRTIKVVIATSILSPLLVTPAVLYVHLKAPKFKPYMEFLAIIPWALPGVVLALAMIRAYISPYNLNRPFLLVMTYVLISLPFMFRSIDSGLSAINAKSLVEAANMLGAGMLDTTRRVLIPNILTGILSGALLVSALASGEFALANLMVGAGWKTFPMFQAQAQNIDGRLASALAMIGLAFTFLISMTLIFITSRSQRGRAAAAAPMANK